MKDTLKAVITVLRSRIGFISFFVASVAIFSLIIAIPVLTVPGNDVLFQLSILSLDLLVIMILLSLGNGLVLAMQLYIHRETKEKASLSEKKRGAVTAGSLVTSIFSSTIACASCYSAVFAFLGLGTTTFLVENRFKIAFIAIAITVYAIHQAAKRINNHCAVCTIKPNV